MDFNGVRAYVAPADTVAYSSTVSNVVEQVATAVLRATHHFEPNNHDFLRYPVGRIGRARQRLRDAVLSALGRAGFYRRSPPGAEERLEAYLRERDSLQRVYDWLADEDSRNVFVSLLAYRVMGARVRLPRNNEKYWTSVDRLESVHKRESDTECISGMNLNRYAISTREGSVELDAHPCSVLNAFLLEQYAYRRGGVDISAGAGDVIIDGGACWGDTALYFAEKVGSTGRVLAFEFESRNLGVFRSNIARNPRLASNIELVERALWSASDETLKFDAMGAGTRLTSSKDDEGATTARTMSVDDAMDQLGLRSVDFIKLDVEGAELEVLRGATATLRSQSPTLAISVYHKEADIVTIPTFLKSVVPNYRFYLDHFTIHGEETVLFATTR